MTHKTIADNIVNAMKNALTTEQISLLREALNSELAQDSSPNDGMMPLRTLLTIRNSKNASLQLRSCFEIDENY